jgi:hypothetical protein
MNPDDNDNELLQDSYHIYREDDVPDEPSTWTVDDFDDLLDLNESLLSE